MTTAVIRRADDPVVVSWVSGSALAVATKCSASAALPKLHSIPGSPARIGSALHEHIRHRNMHGVAYALEMIPALVIQFELDEDEASLFAARARAFEWSPPPGAVAEMALCLFEDGTVKPVKGGRGQYDGLSAGALVPIQIDLFWAEPTPLFLNDKGVPTCPKDSTLWVVDFKSGKESYVDNAEENAQVLAAAVCAAKLTGAERVIPGIVYLRKGQGIWDVPATWLGPRDLEMIETQLRQAIVNVRAARKDYARGLPLVYTEGNHCNMCRSRVFCPTYLSAVKTWIGSAEPFGTDAMLTPDQAVKLAEMQPAFDRFAESVRKVLRAHVEETGSPIVMSDGREWGPYGKTVDLLDPDKATIAVAEVLEHPVADVRLEIERRTVSKDAIAALVKDVHATRGIVRKGAPTNRAIYAEMMKADAIRKITTTAWGAHKPKPAVEALPAERMVKIAALSGIPLDEDSDE